MKIKIFPTVKVSVWSLNFLRMCRYRGSFYVCANTTDNFLTNWMNEWMNELIFVMVFCYRKRYILGRLINWNQANVSLNIIDNSFIFENKTFVFDELFGPDSETDDILNVILYGIYNLIDEVVYDKEIYLFFIGKYAT